MTVIFTFKSGWTLYWNPINQRFVLMILPLNLNEINFEIYLSLTGGMKLPIKWYRTNSHFHGVWIDPLYHVELPIKSYRTKSHFDGVWIDP